MRHVLAAAIFGTLTVGSLVGAGAAHAAVCHPADPSGIVHCDDGSIEYEDSQGNYVHQNADGSIAFVVPPGTPRY